MFHFVVCFDLNFDRMANRTLSERGIKEETYFLFKLKKNVIQKLLLNKN